MLVMAVLIAVTGVAMLVQSRVTSGRSTLQHEFARAQVLWLARSAAAEGKAKSLTVKTDGGLEVKLRVTLRGRQVEAEAVGSNGARAVVRAERSGPKGFAIWDEQYTRGTGPRSPLPQ